MGLRSSREIESRYVSFFLQTDEYRQRVSKLSAGSNINNLKRGHIQSFPFRIAPLREQRRIAERIDELLSDLGAGMAALERVKANLKRYRASVLKAAVEGRLTESWRAQHRPKETGAQLLERILKERRRKWEEDQVAAFAAAGKQPPKNWRARYKEPTPPYTTAGPQLPDGWCWASVEQLSIRSEYGTSVKCDYNANGPPVLRIPNIAAGMIDLSDLKFSTKPLRLGGDDFLHCGDMLMCRTNGSIGLIGKAAVVHSAFARPHAFASYLLRFRFWAADVTFSRWVHAFVGSLPGRRFIERNAASSAGQHNISLSLIHRMPVPLPSIAEQREIIARIDERLSVITATEQQLDVNLRRATRLRQGILKRAFEGKLIAQDPTDEPAAVLLARIEQSRNAATAIQTKGKQPSDEFLRRAAIVSYTVKRLAARPSFGRTQLEKTLHLAQSHLGIDLGLQFERYAAGPFDKSIYRLEATAKKSGWFAKQERRRFGVTYHPGPKIDAMCQHAARLLGEKKADFDRLLDQIAAMNTDEAELFATAYAAWNDLLIDRRPATDAAIIAEVYGWHESKKRFTPATIRTRLRWMRQHGYVPIGQGEKTKPAQNLTTKPTTMRKK